MCSGVPDATTRPHGARLEKLSATIEQPIVLSADLAALLRAGEAVPLGQHQLKDIDAPQAVFGLSGPGFVL